MWEWLQGLSGGAASFIGSFTGAAIGLIALLFGALFNAHLNRRRDDRLRAEERRSIVAALRAELSGFERTLSENAKSLETPHGDFATPDLAQSVQVFPHVLAKIGLLDVDTIRAVIDVYLVLEQYGEQLILLGGTKPDNLPEHRRTVLLMRGHAPKVVSLNRAMSGLIKAAIKQLDKVT